MEIFKMSPSEIIHNVIEPLTSFLVSIDSLNLDEQNARTHNDFNIEAVMKSLTECGQRMPIVVQRSGMIVRAGNARLQAARKLGWTHIAAVVIDESNEAAIQYAIRDNKTGLLGDWDYEVLSDYLKDLQVSGVELDSLGFYQHELDVLLQANFSPPLPTEQKEQEERESLVIHVLGDAVEVVQEAINTCREKQTDGNKLNAGHLIELICKEYLAK